MLSIFIAICGYQYIIYNMFDHYVPYLQSVIQSKSSVFCVSDLTHNCKSYNYNPYKLFYSSNTFQKRSSYNPGSEMYLKYLANQRDTFQMCSIIWNAFGWYIFDFSWIYFKYHPEWMVFEMYRGKQKLETFDISNTFQSTEHAQACCHKFQLQNQNSHFKIFQSRGRMSCKTASRFLHHFVRKGPNLICHFRWLFTIIY